MSSLDFRGGDATGIIAVSEFGKTMWQKASCDAFDFIKERRFIPHDTRSILVHTRMATQGSPAFPENNHPVKRGSVYIVHNGHVMNDWEIFKKAKRDRFGSVDSEAIAALIAKHGIMETHLAMEQISGAAAIGVVDETRPGLMVLARGSGSPLMFYHNDTIAMFGSTVDSVKKAWDMVYGSAPKDKHIESVKEGTALYIDNEVTRKNFVPDDYYTYSSGKHSGYYGNKWTKWDDKELEDEKEDKNAGSRTYIVEADGTLTEMYCNHGCLSLECDICAPEYIDAKAHLLDDNEEICEVCGYLSHTVRPFNVGESSPWYVCKTCVDDLSMQITPEAMSKSIHRLTDAELLATL